MDSSTVSKVDVILEINGDEIIQCQLKRHLSPTTVGLITRMLPLKGNAHQMGQSVVYFETKINSGIEHKRIDFKKGDIAFLPTEGCICFYIDNVSDDFIYMVDGTLESDVSTLKDCSLNPIETDVFTFSDAFQYYRQCLGSDSSFHWKENTYTTLLSEEVIMQVADSIQVKEETETNHQVSEIR